MHPKFPSNLPNRQETDIARGMNPLKLSFVAFIAFVVICAHHVSAGEVQFVKPDPQAMAEADRFLALLDTGKFKDARKLMAKRVRSGGEPSDTRQVSYWTARRSPLGAPVTRNLYRARYSKSISSGPDGNYEFLDYKTRFARKAEGLETVTLTMESGRWEVSGYLVQ